MGSDVTAFDTESSGALLVIGRAVFWTQYYDHAVIQRRMSYLKRLRFRPGVQARCKGFAYTRHERRNGVRLRSRQFVGGAAAYSCWMELEDIIAGLKHFGFTKARNRVSRQRAHKWAGCLSGMLKRMTPRSGNPQSTNNSAIAVS